MKYILISFLVILAGCKKGDTGPQGAQGNANVQTVVTYVDSGNWVVSSHACFTDLGTIGIITPPIVYSGTVNVFMQADTLSTEWLNLPSMEFHDGYYSTYSFSYSLNGVRISLFNSDSTQSYNPGVRAFKIVAISL